jgi:hypothetical protein
MRPARRALPPVLLSCFLLTGCSSVQLGDPTSTDGNSPAAGAPATAAPAGAGKAIAVGAGPQKHYTVQQQPASLPVT